MKKGIFDGASRVAATGEILRLRASRSAQDDKPEAVLIQDDKPEAVLIQNGKPEAVLIQNGKPEAVLILVWHREGWKPVRNRRCVATEMRLGPETRSKPQVRRDGSAVWTTHPSLHSIAWDAGTRYRCFIFSK